MEGRGNLGERFFDKSRRINRAKKGGKNSGLLSLVYFMLLYACHGNDYQHYKDSYLSKDNNDPLSAHSF